MTLVDRINRRLAKEEAEREAAHEKGAPEREARYAKMEALLKEYDRIRVEHPYTVHEDARHIWNHLVDEYQWDLVYLFRRVREGKTP